MGSNPLLTIVQSIIDYVQGPTGKAIALIAIISCGLTLIFGGDRTKTKIAAASIIGGVVLVFSATWIGEQFLGIS
jgi:type IV secretory pathway VirB2 component (pilin)